jgi:hypothetical protein
MYILCTYDFHIVTECIKAQIHQSFPLELCNHLNLVRDVKCQLLTQSTISILFSNLIQGDSSLRNTTSVWSLFKGEVYNTQILFINRHSHELNQKFIDYLDKDDRHLYVCAPIDTSSSVAFPIKNMIHVYNLLHCLKHTSIMKPIPDKDLNFLWHNEIYHRRYRPGYTFKVVLSRGIQFATDSPFRPLDFNDVTPSLKSIYFYVFSDGKHSLRHYIAMMEAITSDRSLYNILSDPLKVPIPTNEEICETFPDSTGYKFFKNRNVYSKRISVLRKYHDGGRLCDINKDLILLIANLLRIRGRVDNDWKHEVNRLLSWWMYLRLGYVVLSLSSYFGEQSTQPTECIMERSEDSIYTWDMKSIYFDLSQRKRFEWSYFKFDASDSKRFFRKPRTSRWQLWDDVVTLHYIRSSYQLTIAAYLQERFMYIHDRLLKFYDDLYCSLVVSRKLKYLRCLHHCGPNSVVFKLTNGNVLTYEDVNGYKDTSNRTLVGNIEYRDKIILGRHPRIVCLENCL